MFKALRKLFSIKPRCTCGSGGHPRRCILHPWSFTQHVAELNHDIVRDDVDDLIIRADKMEAELAALKKTIEQMNKIPNE